MSRRHWSVGPDHLARLYYFPIDKTWKVRPGQPCLLWLPALLHRYAMFTTL